MSKKEKSPKEYRGVIDEIRQQQMKTKEMSAKGKLEYFWDYYKVHTIVAILVIFFAAMFIRDIVTAKDYNFYSILFNARQLSGDSLAELPNLLTGWGLLCPRNVMLVTEAALIGASQMRHKDGKIGVPHLPISFKASFAAACSALFLLPPTPVPITLLLRCTSTTNRLLWSGPDSSTST